MMSALNPNSRGRKASCSEASDRSIIFPFRFTSHSHHKAARSFVRIL